jgi:hypothetical protein
MNGSKSNSGGAAEINLLSQTKNSEFFGILDSPYYVFAALWIVVIVVSLIFKMAYFLS